MKSNKSRDNKAYDRLQETLKKDEIGKCYIFHGEEQYLLRYSLNRIRDLLCPDGLGGFNYKRYDAKSFSAQVLAEAAYAMPLFAKRTLIEVHEVDIFKHTERDRICQLLADLPEYICVIFIYSAIEYSPDGRLKTTKELMKYACVVEFAVQDETKLVSWIKRHFDKADKDISYADAKYLTEISGGQMTALYNDICKVLSYAKERQITRDDINAVVIPILDVEVYRLSDAIVRGNHKDALQILDKLLQMSEAPHKLMHSICLKIRQLLAARVCIDNKINKAEFKKMCGIRYDFHVDILLGAARKTSLAFCRNAVIMCAQTSKELNSIDEKEACIIELVTKLALEA